MSERVVLVTLTLGAEYQASWEVYCRANWEAYAARHGYDVICLDQPLDDSPRAQQRSTSWQKLVVLSQPFAENYDRVIWADADILFHPHAPALTRDVPIGRVGAVDEYASPTPALYVEGLRRLYRLWDSYGREYVRNESAREYYAAVGIEDGFDKVMQAGLLVLSPKYHRALLEQIYASDQNFGEILNAEMRTTSYTLLHADMMHWLDPRWNALWMIQKILRFPFLFNAPDHPAFTQCATDALARSYALHFAGAHLELEKVELGSPQLERVQDAWSRAFQSAPFDSTWKCETPVALIMFNRPETTARVLDAIRTVKPRQLFVIADGVRADHPEDVVNCTATRDLIKQIDWDCAVQTNFAETNLGLKGRVETGLDWVFQNVEEAIILEDDCVPHPTFFRFCQELLEHYREDTRIMTISGTDFTFGLNEKADSYFLSRYPLIWGWATWRRAWNLYDRELRGLREALDSGWLTNYLGDARAAQYWAYVLQENFETEKSWDYNWMLSSWQHDGLSIHPSVNLVSNIGFGNDATHTTQEFHALADMFVQPMEFPLLHPPTLARDVESDRWIEENAFSGALRRVWARVHSHRQRLRQIANTAL